MIPWALLFSRPSISGSDAQHTEQFYVLLNEAPLTKM